jgi:PAS domain S-box-containing protein
MLWIVVASLTVALGIYSSLLYINLKQIIIANQEEHLSSLSVAASREMALWLDGKKREMSAVADSISQAGDHRSSIGARLKRHAMNNPEYEMVFHADTEGNALTSSDFKTSIVDRAYFQQVLITGRAVVSDPVISRQSQRPIVAIAAPVKKGNVVTGVVGCTISLGSLSQLISHIKPVETGYAFVVQGDGTTIIHPDRNLVMKHNILKDPQIDPNLKDAVRKMTVRQAGLTTYVYDHVAKYLAFAPVPGSNWALAINAPVDKVLRELTPINRLIVVTPVFVIVLASVLISILLIVFILRPITMLRNMMSRVEGGDLDVRADYESPDEMGQLTDSFNRMVQNIKEGRERIRQSEENYRHLFENAQEGILIAQGEQILFVNPALVEILGYPKDMITSSSFATFIHPDDREKVLDRHLRSPGGGSAPTSYEFRIVTAEGAEKWLQIKSRMIRWDGVPSSLSFVDNVTDRKRAEDELRASESRFRHYFELPLIGFAITSPGKGWIEANDKLCEILGYSREELYRLTWADLTPGEDLAEEEAVYGRILKGEAGSHTLEKRYLRKDGTVIHAMVSSICVRKPDGAADYFVALVQDITDRRRAEEEREMLQAQLAQAQKMESVGRLAGGVAHDFNNMLGVILGHAELAMRGVDRSHPVFDRLQQIHKAAERSADLTRQLLAFARKQTVAPRVLDLNETVEGMLKMLRRLIGEDIDLVWLPGKNLKPVWVDPSQIDQILANLCVNARDAIGDRGKVTIETGNVVFDETGCAGHAGCVPGDYVMLAVSDDGCGIDREILDRLFDPFFTTKGVGKGTGLGLATVYGIVKQNEGCIDVRSETGRGSTFRIYLPRSQGKAEQLREDESTETTAPGHETILLVEDEAAVLDMCRIMLESLGYRVLSAATPGEAMRIAREHAGEIHLLMTDVVMPEMNGRDLAKNILTLYPNIKRLFMSGYTADVIAHRGILDEGVHLIQKPFDMRTLAARLRGAMGDR